MTVRSRWGKVRASQVTRTEPLEPASPPRRKEAPRPGSRAASSWAAGARPNASRTVSRLTQLYATRSPEEPQPIREGEHTRETTRANRSARQGKRPGMDLPQAEE